MTSKAVTRSVRFEVEADRRLEALALARGLSVSAFIRAAVEEIALRDERRERLERALKLAAEVSEPSISRDEMWGIGSRVPR